MRKGRLRASALLGDFWLYSLYPLPPRRRAEHFVLTPPASGSLPGFRRLLAGDSLRRMEGREAPTARANSGAGK